MFFIFPFFIHGVFAASWNIQSLQEMQDSANNLEKEKQNLDFQWSTFQIGNIALWDMLRDLNSQEKQNLETLITTYQNQKNILDWKLKKKYRKMICYRRFK